MTSHPSHNSAAACTKQTEGHHIDWADIRAAAAAEALLLAAALGPSDLPATQLPDYEPTAADLLAIELLSDVVIDELIAAANLYSAYGAGHSHWRCSPGGDIQTFQNALERVA